MFAEIERLRREKDVEPRLRGRTMESLRFLPKPKYGIHSSCAN